MRFWLDSDPQRVWVQTDEGHFDLNKGSDWNGKDVSVDLKREGETLKAFIRAEKSPVHRVYIAWEVDTPADARVLGDHWERGYGDLEFRGIMPERVLPWYFFVTTGNGKHYAAGVKTGCNTFCSWQLTRDRLVLCIDVRNGGCGVLLNGRTLEAATMVCAEGKDGESVFAFARRYLALLCDNPLMPKQPMYGGNNWYYAYGNSSEGNIIEDSKLISSLATNNENRPWMFIDDGWQICRNVAFTGGPWHTGNYKFPDLPRLCDNMKKEGVKTGIWVRPLLSFEDFPRSWLLPRSRFAEPLLGGEYNAFMDPSIPEVINHIKNDITRIKSWGFDAIKHDYTTYDILGRWGFAMNAEMTNPGWHFADRFRTTMEIVLDLYHGMREAAGEDMLLLACNTISHASAGLAEVQRTGDDTSGRDWERTRKMGINTLAFRTVQHGLFYAADADCIGATLEVPWELNKQWLDLVARSGTPLLVSIDPRTATPEQKKDVTRAFTQASVVQDLAEPLDWLHTMCPSEFKLNGEYTRFHWDESGIRYEPGSKE